MEASAVTLPFSAWDQAVFVALFVVFVIGILAWFSRENARVQRFQDGQNASWQQFLRESNERWQHWLDKSATETVDAMGKVTDALERLSQQLDEHDKRVDARVDAAAAGRKATRPRGGV